ncbi:Photosystem I PsaG/PsaK protein [Corchorus capsularis]|uniref:Photosystem I reaction center subunit V, chloroplastic n=1 Tax=Corchorus capsularis TaxID=210143 RepID=A0A1R3IMP3_COCAP|nr:Photosystem I PsaG/PsaK protein [Corchorus capsularis]
MAMAASSSTLLSPAGLWSIQKKDGIANPTIVSFQGLRALRDGGQGQGQVRLSKAKAKSVGRRRFGVKAELNPQVVISLSTGLSLFLGRFVFFNFQRENVAKQVPEQNGLTHFEAGDTRAKEYVSLLKSNDPVGFNIVDVLAWGSIGHIVAYYILATSSNGYDPNFFG